MVLASLPSNEHEKVKHTGTVDFFDLRLKVGDQN